MKMQLKRARVFPLIGFCIFAQLCALCCKPKPADAVRVTPAPAESEGDLAETLARLGAAQTAAGAAEIQTGEALLDILRRAELPEELAQTINAAAADDPAFVLELLMCLEGDPYLRRLVDKQHPLAADYEPDDLVELGAAGGQTFSYTVNRAGLMLRTAAAESLEEMAAAARADGVTLLASSAYRSYSYQEQVYDRNVRQMGKEAADRESARPGNSQHQSGLTVDFGSIDDSFAQTAAGRWMAANASRFGWSLSFPDGYEGVTGYRWESWHFRYVGGDLAAFIDTYFGGIQQYALRFIFEWENNSETR